MVFRLRNMPVFILLMVFSIVSRGQTGPSPKWGHWRIWGAQDDGTYQNPVLPADYSDIDCIRVGEDYYAISSTFQYSPGVVILRSKDLVNWTITGHIVNDLNQISPAMNWDRMDRYGKGIWAGAIRFHARRFWVYFGTPDEGYFMSTAENPAGPWSPLHRVLAAKGWDDCCPFWDDDGQGYLIGTDFKDDYQIHLFTLTADGKDIVPGSDKIIHHSRGSEANKLYKINGWYYHLFSEVRAEGRAVMMERSGNIRGPYLEEKQMNHAEKKYNEPNQGGLVQSQKGDWYFLTHHGTGDWSGRVVSLLPVTWKEGWPIIGKAGGDGVGQMVWSGRMPLKGQPVICPQTNDDFNDRSLQPQWEWNYQPRKEKWSLTAKPGWLRLQAYRPLRSGDLLVAGNTLTQRVFRTPYNQVTVKLDISGMADGQHAGIAHFGSPDYSTLGVTCIGKVRRLDFRIKEAVITGPVVNSDSLWLRSQWGADGLSRFYYSLDGRTFFPFGQPYQLKWESYRGDRIAIYNFNDKDDAGFIDVDYFHFRFK
jgi:beta-xylosidase